MQALVRGKSTRKATDEKRRIAHETKGLRVADKVKKRRSTHSMPLYWDWVGKASGAAHQLIPCDESVNEMFITLLKSARNPNHANAHGCEWGRGGSGFLEDDFQVEAMRVENPRLWKTFRARADTIRQQTNFLAGDIAANLYGATMDSLLTATAQLAAVA